MAGELLGDNAVTTAQVAGSRPVVPARAQAQLYMTPGKIRPGEVVWRNLFHNWRFGKTNGQSGKTDSLLTIRKRRIGSRERPAVC